MSPFLILLFGFQSALALAFTFFITRLLLKGVTPEEIPATRKRLFWVLVGGGAFVVTIPLLVLLAFIASLPEGESIAIAIWPAVWVAMIMGAAWLGVFGASRCWPHLQP